MPLDIGNVGLWANHFLRPEDLPPTSTTTTTRWHLITTPRGGHRDLSARARDPFAHPNTHSLFYAAQQAPDELLFAPGHTLHHLMLCVHYRHPGSGLDAAVAEVLVGMSRPVTSACRIVRCLVVRWWGWCGAAAGATRGAASAGRVLLGGAAEAVLVYLSACAMPVLTMAAFCVVVCGAAHVFACHDKECDCEDLIHIALYADIAEPCMFSSSSFAVLFSFLPSPLSVFFFSSTFRVLI